MSRKYAPARLPQLASRLPVTGSSLEGIAHGGIGGMGGTTCPGAGAAEPSVGSAS
jgi:hypothetical protein